VVTVVYILTDVASVVGGEVKVLKILTFATNGEKGSLRDSFVIFMPNG